MHTDACTCIYMHIHAYRHENPRDLPRRLSSSFVLASPVSSSSRVRLNQIYYPAVAVCNYASRCMPPHTGMLTLLSLLVFASSGTCAALFVCVCITVTISTAASIQIHTYPVSLFACLLPVDGALRSFVGVSRPVFLQVRHCNRHQYCYKHKHRRSKHRNSHNIKHRTIKHSRQHAPDRRLTVRTALRVPAERRTHVSRHSTWNAIVMRTRFARCWVHFNVVLYGPILRCCVAPPRWTSRVSR